MALEDLLGPDVFWGALVRTNPEGSDPKSEGDDHIRGVKNVALNTNPRVNAAQDWSAAESNQIIPAINDATDEFVGQIGEFALGVVAPYLLCDGGSKVVATYPKLAAYLNDAFGGDGGTNFNVPDYRGKFLRAQTLGSGNDPDVNGRTDRGDGVTGDAAGTQQTDALESHSHIERGQNAGGGVGAAVNQAGSNNPSTVTFQDSTANTGAGQDTRPVNIYVQIGILADRQNPIIPDTDDAP